MKTAEKKDNSDNQIPDGGRDRAGAMQAMGSGLSK
jgi:hypothetical protein